jgi:hypothetical protein
MAGKKPQFWTPMCPHVCVPGTASTSAIESKLVMAVPPSDANHVALEGSFPHSTTRILPMLDALCGTLLDSTEQSTESTPRSPSVDGRLISDEQVCQM